MAALVGVFTVALLHALIPSHWLCFVVVGRAQGWRTRKTLLVAAAAGLLHVSSTIVLGVAGASIVQKFLDHEHMLERMSGIVLIVLSAIYFVAHLLHAGHHHEQDRSVTEKAALVSLLFSLAFSPCTIAIPLLMASTKELGMIALIAAVLLVTTVGPMLLLVGLTSLGIEKLQFAFFDRYEKLIVGLVLALLGALVLVVH
jgi:cytochrome c biogenesis protein CcdA